MKKSVLAILLILTICLSSFAFASSFTDVPDDFWALNHIEWMVKEDIAHGYPDGTFKPNQTINVSEYLTLEVNLFSASEKADVSMFNDLHSGEWFYEVFAKSAALDILEGETLATPHGDKVELANPKMDITRQGAFHMLQKGLKLPVPENVDEVLSIFSDANEIDEKYKASIAALVAAGYIEGYPEGTFLPTNIVSRAEASSAMHKSIDAIVHEDGSEIDVTNFTNTVIIKAKNVTIKGADVTKANIIFVNLTARDTSKGLSADQLKNARVINNVKEAETQEPAKEETKKTSSGGGGGGGGPTASPDCIIKIRTNRDKYTVSREGTLGAGKVLRVNVDGYSAVPDVKITESNLMSNLKKIANKMETQKTINTLHEDYSDDADVRDWGIATIIALITDEGDIQALKALSTEIDEVYSNLGSSDQAKVKTTAMKVLEKAYNNELDDEEANEKVTFDYLVGKINNL